MRVLAFTLALALSAPGAASADSADELAECLDQGWGMECVGAQAGACIDTRPDGDTTAGTIQCIAEETAAWDHLLNLYYQRVIAVSRKADATGDVAAPDRTRESTLRQAQRAWITFRDAECTMWAARWGRGSMAGIAGANCLMIETAERVIDLLALAEE